MTPLDPARSARLPSLVALNASVALCAHQINDERASLYSSPTSYDDLIAQRARFAANHSPTLNKIQADLTAFMSMPQTLATTRQLDTIGGAFEEAKKNYEETYARLSDLIKPLEIDRTLSDLETILAAEATNEALFPLVQSSLDDLAKRISELSTEQLSRASALQSTLVFTTMSTGPYLSDSPRAPEVLSGTALPFALYVAGPSEEPDDLLMTPVAAARAPSPASFASRGTLPYGETTKTASVASCCVARPAPPPVPTGPSHQLSVRPSYKMPILDLPGKSAEEKALAELEKALESYPDKGPLTEEQIADFFGIFSSDQYVTYTELVHSSGSIAHNRTQIGKIIRNAYHYAVVKKSRW